MVLVTRAQYGFPALGSSCHKQEVCTIVNGTHSILIFCAFYLTFLEEAISASNNVCESVLTHHDT
jgi:hypothetical protein